MKYKYTYIADKFLPGGFVYLPLVDINLGEKKVPIKCLIDSGSPITIIHSALAVLAGIIPATGKKSTLLGVGGDVIEGYYHTISYSLFEFDYTSFAFITADLKIPYGLLGKISFFQQNRIIFDLPRLSFEIIQS